MINTEDMSTILSRMINYMLAPDNLLSPDDSRTCFKAHHCPDGIEILFQLKWNVDYRLIEKPEYLLRDLEQILAPISAKITYGEVSRLRGEHAALTQINKQQRFEIDHLNRKIDDLKENWA